MTDYCASCRKPPDLKGRDLRRVSQACYRARNFTVTSTLTLAEWLKIRASADGKCYYCRRDVDPFLLTLDHVIPMFDTPHA